jgi:class III poly(R)-hydroxyalkanoic acid synthase PhaE subunit
MNKNKKRVEKEDPQALYSNWMKAANDFWSSTFKAWTDAAAAFRPTAAPQKDTPGGAKASLDSAMKTWQAAYTAVSAPEILQSLLKGTGVMPEMLVKMAQTSLAGILQFQEKMFERAGRIGKSAEAYKFEDLDENAFRAWAEIYEKEFRQFLHIPQLGLTRFHQEKINRAVDKFNIFQTSFAEFVRFLYLPVTRSFGVLQEKITEMAEAGNLPEDSKAYYQMWIKILEGHYMTLFKSSDYTQILKKTLDDMAEFSSAKNDVIEDMLGMFPIPKQKDMDDLYHEIYLLKKRIKALEKKAGH